MTPRTLRSLFQGWQYIAAGAVCAGGALLLQRTVVASTSPIDWLRGDENIVFVAEACPWSRAALGLVEQSEIPIVPVSVDTHPSSEFTVRLCRDAVPRVRAHGPVWLVLWSDSALCKRLSEGAEEWVAAEHGEGLAVPMWSFRDGETVTGLAADTFSELAERLGVEPTPELIELWVDADASALVSPG